MIRIDLSKPWDWTTNISEIAILKNAQPNTGVTTPVLSRGALFQGTPNDNNIYLWGGTTSYTNTSFPGFRPPNPAAYSLWGYDIHTEQWSHFDVTKGSPNRPSSASYGEAPEQGLGFFFNGELDSGSSTETQVFGDAVKMFIEGMIVVDTKNHTAKNISTSQVSAGFPRSRGRMQYVSSVGERGALIQIGGNRKATNETENTYIGDLVRSKFLDSGLAHYLVLIRWDRFRWIRSMYSILQPCLIRARLTENGISRRLPGIFRNDGWILVLSWHQHQTTQATTCKHLITLDSNPRR